MNVANVVGYSLEMGGLTL